MSFSMLTHLECSIKGDIYDADVVQGLSEHGSPLLARYDLERVANTVTKGDIAARPPTLWRYHELLPVRQPESIVSLGEQMTPIMGLPTYGPSIGLANLIMKDEGANPTGTFKARGACVGVSRAAELGVTGVAMPTNGNAGSAWSMYAARAGMECFVAMPLDAPVITRAECVAAGAELVLVDGFINDAGAVMRRLTAGREGYQDVSTMKEPYRLEGKKTMGYELVEQLGWTVPDVILYPAGGGLGLIGIHKALQEMQEMGWIGPKLPRMVAVQAEGCDPIVRAFELGVETSVAPEHVDTIAFGIAVPKPLGDVLTLRAVRETDGTAIAVSDADLLAEQRALAAAEGAFVCPEGAACFAAAKQLRAGGWIQESESVLVLNTGLGLKYPDTIPVDVPVIDKEQLAAILGGTS